MDWLRANWFWVVVAVGFVWMHLKMHGGHGHGAHGHGGHGGHERSEKFADDRSDEPRTLRTRSEHA